MYNNKIYVIFKQKSDNNKYFIYSDLVLKLYSKSNRQ